MDLVILFLILMLVVSMIPAAIASGKGRPFVGWWLYGIFIWPVALIHALCLVPLQRKED